MARPCSICQNEKVDRINVALRNGSKSFRTISETFLVSEDALRRHKKHLIQDDGQMLVLQFQEESRYWKRYRIFIDKSCIAELNLLKDYDLVNKTLKLKRS